MRKIERTQTDTAIWVGDSAGIATDVEKEGVLTRLDVTVELTPSAAITTVQPDGLFRLIQNLRVLGGGKTFINLPSDDAAMGGTLMHYLNVKDRIVPVGHQEGAVVAPMRTYVPVSWTFHMGTRPMNQWGQENPFDMSALIPALGLTSLRSEWVTAGNDVVDDGITITSAVMRFTTFHIVGTDEELRQEMADQGVVIPPKLRGPRGQLPTAMVPVWETEVFQHTATASDYSERRNLPVGGYLARIAIAEQDATATRSVRASDQVTGVAVILHGEEIVKSFVDHWMNRNGPGSVLEVDHAAPDFGMQAVSGILIKDLRPHGNPDYGLDLTNIQAGAAKLGLTITAYTAGDDSLILYERYEPYFSPIGL